MKYVLEFKHKLKDFEDVYNIEKQYLEIESISTVKQIQSWDKKNDEIHIFVRCLEVDKIVGEITLLPINEEHFIKFIEANLLDTEINSDTLLVYKEKTECYLLFSAIAIDKKYREERKILSLLLEGLFIKIQQILKRNIKILNMCSEGQTIDGQKFIENFMNMKCKNITKENYKIYSYDNILEFQNWIKDFRGYIDKYNEKFYIKP